MIFIRTLPVVAHKINYNVTSIKLIACDTVRFDVFDVIAGRINIRTD